MVVVRAMIKVNGEGQHLTPHQRQAPQPIVTGDYVTDIPTNFIFHPDRTRHFILAHVQICASNCLLGYFSLFGGEILQIVYSQDARTDFDAKYCTSKDVVRRKDVPFWDHKTKI